MPPIVALSICISLIASSIYIADKHWRKDISWAMLLPLVWICILGSRNLSGFFYPHSLVNTPEAYLEGNPVDRVIYAVLIFLGGVVLIGRNISWQNMVVMNKWIFLLFIYYGISIFWSDFPIVSLKRYFKGIGNIIMVMIVITDKKPEIAFNVLIRRFAYILVPLSVVFYKYFPEIGRTYHRYSGELMISGVSTNKNGLGALCLVSAMFLISSIYWKWNEEKKHANSLIYVLWDSYFNLVGENKVIDKAKLYIDHIILITALYLLVLTDSSTPDVCLVIGITLMFVLGFRRVGNNIHKFKKFSYIFMAYCVAVFVLFDETPFHSTIKMTGHADTFWGRVSFWPELISLSKGSVYFGTGYDSYWLGERLEILWSRYWWRPTEAHNGYVEIFLELGLLGLALYFIVFMSSFKKIINQIGNGVRNANTFLLYYVMILLYNIPESAFKGIHIMWFLFLLVSMDYKPPAGGLDTSRSC